MKVETEERTATEQGGGDEQETEKEKQSGTRRTTLKHDRRLPAELERIEHEMTHLLFRSWWTVAKERNVLERHVDYMFMGAKEMKHADALGRKRDHDEKLYSVQWCRATRRVHLYKTHGVASTGRTGVREHHREVRRRPCADELD